MRRSFEVLIECLCCIACFAGTAHAKPVVLPPQELLTYEPGDADIVGDLRGRAPTPSKIAVSDTTWIADWSFDSGGGCTSAGWFQYDNRILNDGSNYWSVSSQYNGEGLIVGNAAKLGRHNLCWLGDGYGNDWDYGICLVYQGVTTLNFDFKIDSEACCDFMRVEADSAGSSFTRLNYTTMPGKLPSDFRKLVGSQVSGTTAAGQSQHFTGTLPDFGVPGTQHRAYIRFVSDGGCSHEDGAIAPTFGAGLVVDNIALTGGTLNYSENFSGAINPNVTFLNMTPSLPFGTWARVYQHITDNDKCTEDVTCAWLWTDPAFIALDASVAYGPGSAVIHNWLDDIIVGPWVSLATTTGASGTVLSYRRFAGNQFGLSKIVQNWSWRSHTKVLDTDTTDPTDSLDCITPWAHASSWNSLSTFVWSTSLNDVSSYVATGAREIQLRWRVSDWQYITGDGPPNPFRTGPGPYLD